jgi:hypothetical protein
MRRAKRKLECAEARAVRTGSDRRTKGDPGVARRDTGVADQDENGRTTERLVAHFHVPPPSLELIGFAS